MSDSERERKHGAQEELHVNEATWGLWIVREWSEWSEWVSGGGSGEKRRWSSSATYPTWPLSLSLCVACACVWCVNVRVMSVSRCLSLSYSRFAFVFIQDSPRIRILLFLHTPHPITALPCCLWLDCSYHFLIINYLPFKVCLKNNSSD